MIVLGAYISKWRLKINEVDNIAHHWIVAFLLFANPFPLLYLWSIAQMCSQKLLYALTLVGWVDSTHDGSQVWSH